MTVMLVLIMTMLLLTGDDDDDDVGVMIVVMLGVLVMMTVARHDAEGHDDEGDSDTDDCDDDGDGYDDVGLFGGGDGNHVIDEDGDPHDIETYHHDVDYDAHLVDCCAMLLVVHIPLGVIRMSLLTRTIMMVMLLIVMTII